MIFFVTSLLRSCCVALKKRPKALSPLVTQSFLPTERGEKRMRDVPKECLPEEPISKLWVHSCRLLCLFLFLA